jgi:hypothetical protein
MNADMAGPFSRVLTPEWDLTLQWELAPEPDLSETDLYETDLYGPDLSGPDLSPEPGGRTSFPGMDGISPIGRQAQEIIASILEDPEPGLTEVKQHLGTCLAANPDFPERALLAHLMGTYARVNSDIEEGLPD